MMLPLLTPFRYGILPFSVPAAARRLIRFFAFLFCVAAAQYIRFSPLIFIRALLPLPFSLRQHDAMPSLRHFSRADAAAFCVRHAAAFSYTPRCVAAALFRFHFFRHAYFMPSVAAARHLSSPRCRHASLIHKLLDFLRCLRCCVSVAAVSMLAIVISRFFRCCIYCCATLLTLLLIVDMRCRRHRLIFADSVSCFTPRLRQML